MLPDPTELVLDFGTLIHGNHPEDDDDDELMLVLRNPLRLLDSVHRHATPDCVAKPPQALTAPAGTPCSSVEWPGQERAETVPDADTRRALAAALGANRAAAAGDGNPGA
ncbi:hypothetical protein BG003_004332 [Podila horticola]|nr:hypothetical protein BG003_004332 [Podila horticola]